MIYSDSSISIPIGIASDYQLFKALNYATRGIESILTTPFE